MCRHKHCVDIPIDYLCKNKCNTLTCPHIHTHIQICACLFCCSSNFIFIRIALWFKFYIHNVKKEKKTHKTKKKSGKKIYKYVEEGSFEKK